MIESIILHVQKTLASVQTVKGSTVRPQNGNIFTNYNHADLVIHTWMGARIYTYFLQSPTKSRSIRGILKANTGQNIGTLFMVNLDLLPEHGEKVMLDDWVIVLQALNDGWVYTYYLDEEENPQISQMEFVPTKTLGEYVCWHVTQFQVQNVSVRHREYRENLRGSYRIGDLVTPAFRRRMTYDRKKRRFHYRTKHTTEVMTAPADQILEYYELLGIDKNSSQVVAKAAYRRMAKKLHPDVSEYPQEEAEQRFKELNDAYDFIKKYRNWK